MNKASIIALLCGLAAGAIGGFGGARLSQSQASTTGPLAETKLLARFGDRKKDSSSGKKENALFHTGMEPFVRRCAEMTGPELLDALQNGLRDLGTGKLPGTSATPMLHYLAYNAGAELPQEALAMIMEAGPEFRDLGTTVFQGWTSRSPEEAARFIISRQKENPELLYLLQGIGTKMAETSPVKAMDWLSTLPDSMRTTALSGIVDTILESSSIPFAEIIQRLKPEDLKSSGPVPENTPADKIIKKWVLTDWSSAEAWIRTQPEELQKKLYSSIFEELSQNDPDQAAKALDKVDDSLKHNLASRIVSGISRQSPEKALDWITQNVSNQEDHSTLALMALISAPITPAIKEKVLKMQESPLRDGALGAISFYSRSHLSPETTLNDLISISSLISDKDARETHIRYDLNVWMKKNPEETKQWIQENYDFSDEWKQILIQRCDVEANTKPVSTPAES